jgi:peptide chain release factor 1
MQEIKKEYNEILKQLSDSELISNWEKGDEFKNSSSGRPLEELIKRKNFLEKIIEKEKNIEELKNKIEENKAILKSQEDQELFSLAETEIIQSNEEIKAIEKEIKELLAEDKNDNLKSSEGSKAVIIEIRAGAGGEEAALFVADLFKMYSKYATLQNWQEKLLDSRPTSLNGFKEIVFEISGNQAFLKMKNEAGVHRVQRIPTTEKSGRVHTSTVSVAVLQKPKKGKMIINPKDLKIDTYKASGPGGQYVNKRETAIRITHLPTGTIVNSQNERSLQQNKENALVILEARILEKKIKEQEDKLKNERKTQIGNADRSEKIRTYNFPQDRITDHRIKKSFHNLEQIMEGKLDPIIKLLIAEFTQ